MSHLAHPQTMKMRIMPSHFLGAICDSIFEADYEFPQIAQRGIAATKYRFLSPRITLIPKNAVRV